MIIVLSPAKSLDYESPVRTRKRSEPAFLGHSGQLVSQLQGFSPRRLCRLMGISGPLGALNAERFKVWRNPPERGSARQAMFAFKGDVYLGLQAGAFSPADIDFAQKHLRILSGLYGVLRPLDLIQPYRLEMGTRLKNGRGADLYAFWGEEPTQLINEQFATLRKTLQKARKSGKTSTAARKTSNAKQAKQEAQSNVLINLASNEYFKVLRPKLLDAEVISPVFKDKVKDDFRVVSFFAKKARGSMAAWIIRNRVTDPSQLSEFNVDGYRYHRADSSPAKPVFHRRKPPPPLSAKGGNTSRKKTA